MTAQMPLHHGRKNHCSEIVRPSRPANLQSAHVVIQHALLLRRC